MPTSAASAPPSRATRDAPSPSPALPPPPPTRPGSANRPPPLPRDHHPHLPARRPLGPRSALIPLEARLLVAPQCPLVVRVARAAHLAQPQLSERVPQQRSGGARPIAPVPQRLLADHYPEEGDALRLVAAPQ